MPPRRQSAYKVTLIDAADEIGGQFNLAVVPGKEEFYETLRYYGRMIEKLGIELRLNTRAVADMLGDFEHVVVATGITPRVPDIEGINHEKAVSYIDVLKGNKPVGSAWRLWARAESASMSPIRFPTTARQARSTAVFAKEWGVDFETTHAAGSPLSLKWPAPIGKFS